MCEYCGCQNVPAIARLTAEHDEIRAAARKAHRAARRRDFAAARGTVQHLLVLLEPHTAIEERGLFPSMSREFPEHISSLEKDHRRIRAALERLARAETAYDGWEAELARTAGALFEHILREQDGVFPASLSVLVPAEWDELDAAREAVAQVTFEIAR
jgi:hemerythrin-like domain-containing protein